MAARRAVQSLLVLGLLSLMLAGCSSRFFYNQLDTLIVWKAGDYVTLSREQQQAFQSDVQQQLVYVQRNEMPRIAALFAGAAQDMQTGYLEPQRIDAYYDEMLAIYDTLMLGLVPLSHRLLYSLDDAQIDELFSNLEAINDEMYADYSGSTPDVREENRNKSAVKSIQRYTGRLTGEQRAFVHAELARMEDASEQWISYQRDWQQRFRVLVESRPDDAEYMAELTGMLVYPRDVHSAGYRARVDANRVLMNVMLAELFNGLSDRQRGRMVRKLQGYADTVTGLAAAG